MNAAVLLTELEARNVVLMPVGADLLVDAPHGALTEELRSAIAANKAQLISELAGPPFRAPQNSKAPNPLAEYAADRAPAVRFTLRETEDVTRDVQLLNRARLVIQEHQPGGNHIYLTIRTLDRRRVTVEWRALATRSLRIGIALVLARASRSEAAAAADPGQVRCAGGCGRVVAYAGAKCSSCADAAVAAWKRGRKAV